MDYCIYSGKDEFHAKFPTKKEAENMIAEYKLEGSRKHYRIEQENNLVILKQANIFNQYSDDTI